LIGFDKYRVLADERKQIAKLIKEQEPKVSNRQIAKLVGTSHQSVGRDVGPSGPLRGDNPNQIKGANVVSGPSGPLGAPADISGGRAARLVMQRETGAANRIAKLVGVASKTVDRDIAPSGAVRGKKPSNNNGPNKAGASSGATVSGAKNDISGEHAAKLVMRRASGGAHHRSA